MEKETQRCSPSVKRNKTLKRMSFSKAIEEIIKGEKITKLEWKNKDIYGVLKNGYLMIYLDDKQFHKWLVSDGDIYGDDWIVVDKISK